MLTSDKHHCSTVTESDSLAKRKALPADLAAQYLAQRFGLVVSKQRVWHLARAGLLPCVRIGRKIWFQVEALNAFVHEGGRGYAHKPCARTCELVQIATRSQMSAR